MIMSEIKKLKPCPFCGSDPAIETLGTTIDISCCAHMSAQYCDIANEWDSNKRWHVYPQGDLEKGSYFAEPYQTKAINTLIDKWNTRTPLAK